MSARKSPNLKRWGGTEQYRDCWSWRKDGFGDRKK